MFRFKEQKRWCMGGGRWKSPACSIQDKHPSHTMICTVIRPDPNSKNSRRKEARRVQRYWEQQGEYR